MKHKKIYKSLINPPTQQQDNLFANPKFTVRSQSNSDRLPQQKETNNESLSQRLQRATRFGNNLSKITTNLESSKIPRKKSTSLIQMGVGFNPKPLRNSELPIQAVRSKKGSSATISAADDKLKGEDYVNNLKKLMEDIKASLPGLIGSEIEDNFNKIDDNRSKCAIPTSEVTGEDTNKGDYGILKQDLVNSAKKIYGLLQETDLEYFQDEIREPVKTFNEKINALPTKAIDRRVAMVIDSDRGSKAEKEAKGIIDEALLKIPQLTIDRLNKAVDKKILKLSQQLESQKKKKAAPSPPPNNGTNQVAEDSVSKIKNK